MRPPPAYLPQTGSALLALVPVQLEITQALLAQLHQTEFALHALRARQAPITKQQHAHPPPTESALLALRPVQREITQALLAL